MLGNIKGIFYFCQINIKKKHMKKSIILAAIALSFGLTACNQQKKVKAEMPTAEMQCFTFGISSASCASEMKGVS